MDDQPMSTETVVDIPSGRVERVCFHLQVRPELIDEYRQRHAAVWPEMLGALHAAGWTNYSLFLRDDGLLIGYFETTSLRDAQARMAVTEVNERWQGEMSRFFIDLDGSPDEGLLRLTEVFHLEDQLATARARDIAPTESDAS